MECYNIAKNQWTMGPDMNSRRAMHNACVLGDLLYVFGGAKNAAKDL